MKIAIRLHPRPRNNEQIQWQGTGIIFDFTCRNGQHGWHSSRWIRRRLANYFTCTSLLTRHLPKWPVNFFDSPNWVVQRPCISFLLVRLDNLCQLCTCFRHPCWPHLTGQVHHWLWTFTSCSRHRIFDRPALSRWAFNQSSFLYTCFNFAIEPLVAISTTFIPHTLFRSEWTIINGCLSFSLSLLTIVHPKNQSMARLALWPDWLILSNLFRYWHMHLFVWRNCLTCFIIK